MQQKGWGSDTDEEWWCYVSEEEMWFWLCSVLLLSSRGTLLARVRFIFLLIHEYWSASAYGPLPPPLFFLFQQTPRERTRRFREDRRDGLDKDDNDADDAFCIFDLSPFFSVKQQNFNQRNMLMVDYKTPEDNFTMRQFWLMAATLQPVMSDGTFPKSYSFFWCFHYVRSPIERIWKVEAF